MPRACARLCFGCEKYFFRFLFRTRLVFLSVLKKPSYPTGRSAGHKTLCHTYAAEKRSPSAASIIFYL